MSEEESQSRLEAGEKITGKDAGAYRKVFGALEREPDFRLPMNFADSVMTRIESKQESRNMYLVISGVIVFFVIATVVTYLMMDFRLSAQAFRLQTDLSAYQFVKNYFGLFIFAASFIVLLQWLDKRFIKPSVKDSLSL